ncbi:MAG TPA: TraR/DksA C4-type zinc finger protein [Acidimicrobiales bacterium]|jgi:RNA polymerase-binding transcription factor DksA|nr:TraR/DksA C4-type zinc finger protein [Acidimicrobiales bacterium]
MSDQPSAPGLSPSQRATLTALLVSEGVETSERIAALVERFEAVVEVSALSAADDEHDPEGATVGFERAQLAALIDEARRHLDAVEAAAQRLAGGDYGVCQSCGRPIGVDRLMAHPVARTCVACAAGVSSGLRRRISGPGSR